MFTDIQDTTSFKFQYMMAMETPYFCPEIERTWKTWISVTESIREQRSEL